MCEDRKSHAELNPALVTPAKRLRRQKPKGGRMSLHKGQNAGGGLSSGCRRDYWNSGPAFERWRRRWTDEPPFKVVRSNSHDELLARAINQRIARGAYREGKCCPTFF
jgi:hypothetical protein